MITKTSTGLQRQAVQSALRCVRERKAVPKGECAFVEEHLKAVDARLARAQEAENARERQREARDAEEIMGGGN